MFSNYLNVNTEFYWVLWHFLGYNWSHFETFMIIYYLMWAPKVKGKLLLYLIK